MRYLYQKHWSETITQGGGRRICSERVKAGWILEAHLCYLHLPESKINDVATILVDIGGEELVLRSRARDAAKQGMSTIRPFHVGEHRRVIGYAPNADAGNTISLSLCGEMIPLKKWKKGKM